MNREELAAILKKADGLTGEDINYLGMADAVLQHLASQRQEQGEDLQAARAIGESFFEALKPLNLQAINVANPGQHVTDLIALVARLGEYARHKNGCAYFVMGRDKDCSCGYAAIVAEIASTTPTP